MAAASCWGAHKLRSASSPNSTPNLSGPVQGGYRPGSSEAQHQMQAQAHPVNQMQPIQNRAHPTMGDVLLEPSAALLGQMPQPSIERAPWMSGITNLEKMLVEFLQPNITRLPWQAFHNDMIGAIGVSPSPRKRNSPTSSPRRTVIRCFVLISHQLPPITSIKSIVTGSHSIGSLPFIQ